MIDDLIERYRVHLKRTGYAAKSIELYVHALGQFASFLDGQCVTHPSEMTRDTIQAYQAALYTSTTVYGRPLALKTQGVRLQAVLSFLKYLVREGVLLMNPGDGIEMPRFGPRNPPRNVPTEAQVEAFLAAPDAASPLGIRDRAMLELLYSTGIRVGELVRLKVYDVDLTQGLLRVIAGKGGKDRTVPVGQVAARAVRKYLETVRAQLLRGGSTTALFLSETGRPVDKGIVQHWHRMYSTRAGLERRITPHSLRHACATHMLKGKASVRHIQELLGHRQLSTTQLYTHVDVEDLRVVHARTHPRERRKRTRPGSTRSSREG